MRGQFFNAGEAIPAEWYTVERGRVDVLCFESPVVAHEDGDRRKIVKLVCHNNRAAYYEGLQGTRFRFEPHTIFTCIHNEYRWKGRP